MSSKARVIVVLSVMGPWLLALLCLPLYVSTPKTPPHWVPIALGGYCLAAILLLPLIFWLFRKRPGDNRHRPPSRRVRIESGILAVLYLLSCVKVIRFMVQHRLECMTGMMFLVGFSLILVAIANLLLNKAGSTDTNKQNAVE